MKRFLMLVVMLVAGVAFGQGMPHRGGTGGGFPINCPTCNLVDNTLTLSATGNALILPTNGKLCLNGSTCSASLRWDTVNVQLGMPSNSTLVIALAASVGESLQFGLNKGSAANTLSTGNGLGGTWLANASDGASAVAFTLNNGVTLATAGAKLESIQNNGGEKRSLDKDGNAVFAGVVRVAGAASGGLQVGSCTTSSATSCTLTVQSGAKCVASSQGGTQTVKSVAVSSTTATVTATASGSDTFTILCL